jgi:hypothetical protein
MSNVLFENERYIVLQTEFPHPVKTHGGMYDQGYSAINRETGVAEVFSAQLPDAIAAAEQLDIAMETQPWKWVRIQASADSVNPDGTPKDPEGPVDQEIH